MRPKYRCKLKLSSLHLWSFISWTKHLHNILCLWDNHNLQATMILINAHYLVSKEYPKGEAHYFTLCSRNLFLWRHLDINSVPLFSWSFGSALTIATFSGRQRSHFLVPHLYGDVNDAMPHLRMKFALLSFSFHIFLESSDSLQYCLDLKDLVHGKLRWRRIMQT